MAKGSTLREMFIKIRMVGQGSVNNSLGRLKGMFKSLVGDVNLFKANLASAATVGTFRMLGNAVSGIVGKFKELTAESVNLNEWHDKVNRVKGP